MVDLKQVQKDVDKMTSVFDTVPNAGAEEFRTDPPPTDAPKTASPGTEAPPTNAPNTEVPPTDAPKTESPSTKAPSTEAPQEDERDKEIRDLREKLALKEAKPTEAPPTKAPATDAPISEEDFLGDADLDELTRDPSLFNKLLNKIYKKGREDTRAEIRQGDEFVMRSMPDIVKNNIALVSELQKISDKFYEDNKDLKPFKRVVGAVFEELIAGNPSKKYDELLPEVEKETRKRLDLHRKATDKKADPPPLPKRGKGGKRQELQPDATPLQNELADMDKVLDY
jgi:hypothetical protein